MVSVFLATPVLPFVKESNRVYLPSLGTPEEGGSKKERMDLTVLESREMFYKRIQVRIRWNTQRLLA